MVYRAIGVLSSPAGVSFSFATFQENAGNWGFELIKNKSYAAGGIDTLILDFIAENDLQYQAALITVHAEAPGMLYDGPSIAAVTRLPVITNLTELDMVLGGNGEFYKGCAGKLGIDEKDIDEVNKSMCIAFMGILRWREEYNFLSSLTGASRSSIGGAVWLGQEA